MGSFNTGIAALLLCLSIATAYTTPQPPKAPAPISLHNGTPSNASMDEKAKDLHYLKVHFTSLVHEIDRFLGSIKPWMYADYNTPSCECSHLCGESFADVMDRGLRNALHNLEARHDWDQTFNDVLIGIYSHIGDCQDCLYEQPYTDREIPKAENCPDIGKFNAWVKDTVDDLLAIGGKYKTVPP